jgi:hypothetical protein
MRARLGLPTADRRGSVIAGEASATANSEQERIRRPAAIIKTSKIRLPNERALRGPQRPFDQEP